jgi:hypothetical protein
MKALAAPRAGDLAWKEFSMAEAMVLALNLLIVEEIQKNETEVVLRFVTGQKGRLATDHKDFDYFMRLAQRSLDRKHPVAVSMAKPDKIVELARADNDIPAQFSEHDKERMKVVFQGHDGIFYLRRDHTEFKRISEALQQSIKEKKRVWFVAEKPSLLIKDVIRFEEPKQTK